MATQAPPSLVLAAPWPPAKSDIARHVAEILLPALRARFDVIPVGAEADTTGPLAIAAAATAMAAQPNAALLAHVGNEARQNDAALAALAQRPGVVVMHDIVLHHAWYDACLRADRFDDYLASVRQHGGAALAEQALLARHHSAPVHRLARSLPLFEPFLRNASGVVVHSQMAFDAVTQRGPWLVRRLDLPTPMPASAATVLAHRQAQAQALQPGEPLRLILFGYLGPNRCLPQILDALATLRAQGVPVSLDIYGQLADPAATQQAVVQAGLAQQVTLHGFVSNAALDEALQHAHLACNFRTPTMGEASGSQLRLYAAGLPALVCRTGWYAEQPASAVLHVEPGQEATGLVAAVQRLRAAPAELAAMAQAGLQHLQQRHDPAHYVAQLADFLAECAHTAPAHRLARHYVGLAAQANAALQLPITPAMAQQVAELSGLVPHATPPNAPAQAQAQTTPMGQWPTHPPSHLHAALHHASQAAAPAPSHTKGHPMPEPSSTFAASAEPHRSATSPDLAALATRAQPRTALPSSLQHPWLDKLGIARGLLKVWNFFSREWREPIALTHRILSTHELVVADMRHLRNQLAQVRAEARQQTLMARAELVALEEQLAQLSARLQPGTTAAPTGVASAQPSTLEDNFLQAVADHFRGDPAQLRARLAVHLPAVAEALARVPGPAPALGNAASTPQVLDLGCGRGEWLALLQEAGHAAQGIDLSVDCVSACQAQGLNARLGDALRVLQQTPANSVAVVTAFHLVEHLPLAGQIALFNEARRVLAPGGLLLAETPNPENLGVISRNFWYDPTHQRPVPAEMLRLLAKDAGFTQIDTQPLQPPPVPSLEVEQYPPRLRHMLFCGEDTVVRAVKTSAEIRENPVVSL